LTQRVGARLRSIRQQKGLSLHEVEAMSDEEFKVDPGATDLSEGFAVNLNRLQECREPEALALARLVAMIQAQRQDFNGRVLSIRANDLRALAYFFLSTPEDLCGRLTGLALQALPA
jgi:transcriptional regulator with XRE-family HTH domain